MTVDSISVVICTHDRPVLLAQAARSLAGQRIEPDRMEVIIVENGPAAHPDLAEIRGRYPAWVWLHEPALGLSRARNLGLRHSRSDIIAFLDDDAQAAPDWAAVLLRVFSETDFRPSVVGGAVLPIWQDPPPPWLLPPDVDTDDIKTHDFPLIGNFSIVNWGGMQRVAAPGEWFAGANIAFDRKALQQVGGFSAALGRRGHATLLGNEESEAAHAVCGATGGQRIYAPDARVRHLIPADRVRPAWIVRRVVWQVISDALSRADVPQVDPGIVAECRARLPSEMHAGFGTDLTEDILNEMDHVRFRAFVRLQVEAVKAQLCGQSALP